MLVRHQAEVGARRQAAERNPEVTVGLLDLAVDAGPVPDHRPRVDGEGEQEQQDALAKRSRLHDQGRDRTAGTTELKQHRADQHVASPSV
jgi:hypothetical protein